MEDFLAFGGRMAKICYDILCGKSDLSFSFLMKTSFWKGFTLIEMLIVVVVIGILTAVGMGLSWSSLEKLKVKAVNEEFAGFFDTLFLQVNASNYYQWKPFSGITLKLSVWENQIPYAYWLREWDELSWTFAGKFEIAALSGDGEQLSSVEMLYLPFSPECSISHEGKAFSHLTFSIRSRGTSQACFEIAQEYCKLKMITCQ